MSILHMSLTTLSPPQALSSAKTLFISPITIPITTKLYHLSFRHIPLRTTPIRMGGGPRTYPGGVSKWQWKRMQAKKAKQLLQARLARERQIYEMRKRAELKAAVSELERPWEAVEKPPNLFSVGADEQLKVLADRFQKPGGLDLWSERDGPELFRPDNGLPSSRFFPKGVVHSVKPYGKVAQLSSSSEEFESLYVEEDLAAESVCMRVGEVSMQRKGYHGKPRRRHSSLNLDGASVSNVESRSSNGMAKEGNGMMKGNGRKHLSDSEQKKSGYDGRNQRRDYGKSRVYEKGVKLNSEVFDMNLQNDGSYGL